MAVRIFSGVLFVVVIVVVPVLYWYFGREAAEQDPNKARGENEREEPECRGGEHGSPTEKGD